MFTDLLARTGFGTGFLLRKIDQMSSTLLKNVNVVLPERVVENGAVRIEDGLISAVYDRPVDGVGLDLDGATVYPGFIDIHIHGSAGIDTNTANVNDLKKMAGFLASEGVTAWMPTLVPDSDETYKRTVAAVDDLIEIQGNEPAAEAVGLHYEGVFANEKMCGALRPEYFKTFTGVIDLPELRSGVHLITLAPEVENGIELIRALVENGWVASIGHTNADTETLKAAFEAGARHLTHFYNAMTGLHHRDSGVVGWALHEQGVTFDVIPDGIHVNEDMLDLACRIKSPDKVSLISDAVLPTGLGDGEFEIWGEKISVTAGKTQNERGSIAGSVISMLDGVRRMLRLGYSPVETAKMASFNPAKLLGLEDSRGSIKAGKRADLVALDADGSIVMSMVGGMILQK